MKPRQLGIALIQVLIITAGISLLALYFSQTARLQVKKASMAIDQANALVTLHNSEAKMLYALATEDKNPNKRVEINQRIPELSFIQEWNFHGQVFEFSPEVQVELQDLRGLLNLHYPNAERLKKLFVLFGLSDYDAELTLHQILDWQDTDTRSKYNMSEPDYRNGALQDITELSHLPLSAQLIQVLQQTTTLYKKGNFNPMSSPDYLLKALLEPSLATNIITLRNNRQLSREQFAQLSGFTEGDGIILYPSNMFRVKFMVQVGEAKVTKVVTWQLAPSKMKPVNLVAVENQ